MVKSKEVGDAEYMVECAESEPGDLVVRGGNVMGNGYVESALAGNVGITARVLHSAESEAARGGVASLWYTNLGDRAFYRVNDADGEKDIYWQSRDSALLIKGGSNYAYEQINGELTAYLTAHPTLALSSDRFSLAVVGLKLDSEHEDTCIATIELHGERADSSARRGAIETAIRVALGKGLASFKTDFPDAMARVEVSKAAHPDRVLFAKVHKNFKGAILTKELKKQAEELLALP